MYMLKGWSSVWQEQLRNLSKRQPQGNEISTSFWRSVQDTDFAAREAHYHASCRWGYDDRHQETIKDPNTIEEQAAYMTFQYIVQYVKGSII